jgi:uracil-DNA glycosylase
MRWTERQRAMLGEMGIRLWPAVGQTDADANADADAGAGAGAMAAAGVDEAPLAAPPVPVVAVLEVAPVPAALATRPPGIGSMGWDALRTAVAGCTACKLCKGRTQTVFGVGHTSAHWLIVGEAPGEQEDRQGEPFVGASGQLLDNMLRAIHLTRGEAEPARQVYIANTVKCRPPGNRNPEPEELAQCEPFLIRQVELLRPRIILAMGRFAVQSLLRSSEPIGRLRGRVHRYQGVPLIVTYHPAYLLRNLQDKARAWDDLCLAADTAAAAAATAA